MSDADRPAETPPAGAVSAEDRPVCPPWLGGATAVARAAVALAAEEDEERVPERIVDACVELFAADATQLLVPAPPAELHLVAHRNLDPTTAARAARIPLDRPLAPALAARTRTLQHVPDLARDEAHRAIAGISHGALVAAPLVARGRLRGVLLLAREAAPPLAPEEREAFSAMAELFALSLEEARLRATRRRQRAQLEAIRGAGLAIARAGDLREVLQTIVDRAREIAAAKYAALGIVAGPDRPFDPWVFSGMGPGDEARIGRHPRPVGLLGAVTEEGRTIRIPEASRDPRFRGFPPAHPRMHAFLGVPIPYEREIIGNLYLTDKVGAPAFTADDQHAMEILARHAGIAVQQARARERIEREVEERRRSEEALRRSQAQLARAQQVARLGSWEYDPETREVSWSEEVFRILGLAPGSVRPSIEAFLDAVPPEDREQLRDSLETSFRTGAPFRYQTRIRRPDGTERLVRREGREVAGEDGRRIFVGTIQDITDRVRAQEERIRFLALARERTWLRTVIERSPVGILLYEGPDGSLRITNHRAEEILGGPPDPRALLHPDRTPIAPGSLPWERALAGNALTGEEYLLVRGPGDELPILVSAGPIREAGAIVGAVVTIEDIRPLKELARLREEWTSVVAHDLRQPVTTISAYGSLLGRHRDPTVRTRAGHITAAVKRLDRMIADLLDVSRLEAHRMSLDLQEVALPPLLVEVAERIEVGSGDSEIRVEAPADLPPVRADPSRLEQVLVNLLSNAVKYGFGGTPIGLAARRVGDGVEIAVENRGPGIPPADLPRLFQRFQRSRRVSRVAGIGLGLYIARGIVEAHGGRIWVESTPGETTTFRFILPVADGAAVG